MAGLLQCLEDTVEVIGLRRLHRRELLVRHQFLFPEQLAERQHAQSGVGSDQTSRDLGDRSWPVLRRVMAGHTLIYRASGGLIGHKMPGAPPTLLLTHVGAKSGQAPFVEVFTGRRRVRRFRAFGNAYRYGLLVALSDVNGDGKLEILVRPQLPARARLRRRLAPIVKVFSAQGVLMAVLDVNDPSTEICDVNFVEVRCDGFRRTVLSHLPEIGYGHTASYATIAQLAGNPKAVRAVGSACATNPMPVVVPCHRLIGANGSLVKYGSGLARKRWLLAHEGVDWTCEVR